jgi:hypothetical protein
VVRAYGPQSQFSLADARRLHWMLNAIELPLIDYIIIGEAISSLRQQRII